MTAPMKYEVRLHRTAAEGVICDRHYGDDPIEAACNVIAIKGLGIKRYAAAVEVSPFEGDTCPNRAKACYFTALAQGGAIRAWWDADGELRYGDETDPDVLRLNALCAGGVLPISAAERFNAMRAYAEAR